MDWNADWTFNGDTGVDAFHSLDSSAIIDGTEINPFGNQFVSTDAGNEEPNDEQNAVDGVQFGGHRTRAKRKGQHIFNPTE
jgi:hypothetical protein